MSDREPGKRRRPRWMFWAVPVAREVDEEIAGHLEMQTRRFIDAGMSPSDAREAALRRFGDPEPVRRECREIRDHMEAEMRRAELWNEVRQDLSFAIRGFRKSPLYAAIALLTLALGVGATTAIFSVVNTVMLRPLPYAHADRTVMVWNGNASGGRTAVSAPEYWDLKEQLRSFDEVAAVGPQSSSLVGDGEPEQVMAYIVSPNLFDLLGSTPLLGRGFNPADGDPATERVVLLSHALWVRRFGGDRALLGKTINLAGRVRTVVGVMPPDVRFPDAPLDFLRERADVWIPSSRASARGDSRGDQYLAVVARLKAGATERQGRADLDAISARFRLQFPDRYASVAAAGWGLTMLPLRDQMVGPVRLALLVISAAVGLLLFIACVNVANLMLARGAVRQREMTVRTALGANRARLLRQLLTESTLLGVAGGVLGVALAWVGVRALARMAPGSVPMLESASIDPLVLTFSLAVSTLTGLGVGLVPALQQSRTNLQGVLGDGSRGASDGRARRRLRTSLVVAEVAMALVILVGAGLLGRSFAALQAVRPGFSHDATLSLQLSLPRARYDSAAKLVAFFDVAMSRIAQLPGVTASGAIHPLPMSGSGWGGSFTVEGEPSGPNDPLPHAEYAVSTPGYFRTVRIPLLEGRDFTSKDTPAAPWVVIIDQELAKAHWPNESAIGKRLNPGLEEGQWATVIGVVGHIRRAGPRDDGEPQIYLPYAQRPQGPMAIVARGGTNPMSLAPAVRNVLREIDPDLPLVKVQPMDDVVAGAIERERFNMLILAVFALSALALASVGLYGVMSYLVSQRSREIGIRMALGGRPNDVRNMVMRESLLIVAVGLLIGSAISLVLSRGLSALLFGVAATDLTTYASIVVLLFVVALLSAFGPARRATRIDPVASLRE